MRGRIMGQVLGTVSINHNSISFSRAPRAGFFDRLLESESKILSPARCILHRIYLKRAGRLEKKGELLRAARIYEKLGMHDEKLRLYLAKAGIVPAEQCKERVAAYEEFFVAAQIHFRLANESEDLAVKASEFEQAEALFSHIREHNIAIRVCHSWLKSGKDIEDKMHIAHLMAGHCRKGRAFEEMAKVWLDLSYESQSPRLSRQMFVLAGDCMMDCMDYNGAMNYFFIALRDESDTTHRLRLLGKIGECFASKGHMREAVLCFAAIYHHLDDVKDFSRKWELAMRIDYLARNAGMPRYSTDVIKSLIFGFEKPEGKSKAERLNLLKQADCVFCDMARGEGFDPEKIEPPRILRAA